MDGGGDGDGAGRCMEGGRGEYSDINRILLRYRPIAPKPVVGGSGTGGGGGSSVLSGKRTKRKYVRVSSGRCKNKDKEAGEKRIVTLQLLPERADLEAGRAQLSVGCSYSHTNNIDLGQLQNNNNNNNDNNIENILYGVRESGRMSSRVIESWVTVESVVMDKRMPEAVCGWNAEEEEEESDNFVRQKLEGDSCPGFFSRAESGRVEWVNEAYRRMVGCGSDSSSSTMTVVVWLEIKQEAAVVISQLTGIKSFSCWVKIQYNNSGEDGRSGGVSMVLPCDAWRVEGGGFAWRLDARAALCLGRY